jgi:glycosyltransferase involved in cell wall biosynthesis
MGENPKTIMIFTGLAYSLVNFRLDLIKQLRDMGWRVVAVVPTEEVGLVTGESEISFVTRVMADLGVEVELIRFARTSIDPLRSSYTALSLARLIMKYRPSVFLAYTVKAVLIGGLSSWIMRVPRRVLWLTGLGSLFFDQNSSRGASLSVARYMLGRVLGWSTKVLLLNQDNLKTLTTVWPNLAMKCEVVVEGLDLSRFCSTPANSTDEPVRVLMIARLLIDKGVREYIQAAKLAKLTGLPALFELVGPFDTNPSAISENELQAAINEGWISYHGPAADVYPFLLRCDVFCLPSYHEGMPRTIMEAMAVGRPVVSTNAPGCREAFIENEHGLMVSPKDPEALFRALRTLIINRSERERMGRAAAQHARRSFDASTVSANLARVILGPVI